ncbi:MAG: 4-hydroxybenzoate octaprenyltransferase [Endozoicomonadaceae bacterium]|nr:4-hydroxybenzoate octaprenyltransferase [Endozoicomonadaceae bacterium]
MLHLSHLPDYLALIRFYNPIGSYLLIWPSLWSLWLANQTAPDFKYTAIFILGAFFMRSAGCIINDYADRYIDRAVQRTQNRPLAQNRLTKQEVITLLLLLLSCASVLLLFLNTLTQCLACSAIIASLIYPWMKRYTHWPQAVLSLAFTHTVLMAWTSQTNQVNWTAGWLMGGTFFWIIAYDTYYAMVDREDDMRIGVHSTAILFGAHDRHCIAILNVLTLSCFSYLGYRLNLNLYYTMSLLITAGLFLYQYVITRHYSRQACLQAFLLNHWVGCILFLGILMSLT